MAGDPDRARDLRRLAEIWKGLGLRVKTAPGWEERGAPGNTANNRTSYWVPRHSPRVFVEQVDTVTGVGPKRAKEARRTNWSAVTPCGANAASDRRWRARYAARRAIGR